MKRFDLTFPVRTRGGLALPAGGKTGPEAILTQGAIRTRGAAVRAVPVPPLLNVGRLESLGELFAAVRNRVEDLPLVVIVFGWHPSSIADQFGAELRDVVAGEDRVWWVGMPGAATLEADPQPGLLLDLATKLDMQILRNQPAEIVFLSGEAAMAEREKAYMEAIAGMPVVVLAPDSPEGRGLAESATEGTRNLFTINGAVMGAVSGWICVCPESLFN